MAFHFSLHDTALVAAVVAVVPAAASAQSLLHSDRALLGLAIALSLPHAAAEHAVTQRTASAPLLAQSEPGGQSGPAIDRRPGGAPVPGTGDSGAGARTPPMQGGPNGPDDRNAGSGGPTGGTSPPDQRGGTLGTGPAGSSPKSSGDDSGSGSESNGGNQRGPAPQQ